MNNVYKREGVRVSSDNIDYYNKIKGLNFLKNKTDFLDEENSFKIHNNLLPIIDNLEEDWFSYTIEKYWHLMIINLPNWKNKIIFWWDYWLNSSVVRRVFDDKIFSNFILNSEDIKTPNEKLIIREDSVFSNKWNKINDALVFSDKLWFPLIIKPFEWSHWDWVYKIFNKIQLNDFLEKFNNWDLYDWDKLIIQEFIRWNDCRVLFLNWEILAAYKRTPPEVVWDWNSTIYSIIRSITDDISEIEKIKEFLEMSWIKLDGVLSKNEKVEISATANISTWWSAEKILFDYEDLEFCKKISNTTGANYFWLDVIFNKKISDWTIIEINKSPWIEWISDVDPDFKREFWKKFIMKLRNRNY